MIARSRPPGGAAALVARHLILQIRKMLCPRETLPAVDVLAPATGLQHQRPNTWTPKCDESNCLQRRPAYRKPTP